MKVNLSLLQVSVSLFGKASHSYFALIAVDLAADNILELEHDEPIHLSAC
jgi:hypothetical protein